ncbi:winged helix-turn-helix domain-containing protein [Alteromonas sp. ASW11-130]|uniref:winged helix-turn-helix domain-containing protein n=1 Tax=Alteromonas sp. ASW11-130 TaxID=3015775 RepID=UPI0022426218|nr:winged helix-turn-helix domain-containing protein [Alteromonas sp. ASW11-130]MCW8090892.1 winged helix-turn-helix domain-containing protein [Alteromonas sp. ASW11-130]
MEKDIDTHSHYVMDGRWQFTPTHKTLKYPGGNYILRNKTVDVLLLLLQTPGQIVQSKTFFDVVWQGKCVSENVLKQSISELRQCFKDNPKNIIVTIPKVGYLLQCDVVTYATSTSDPLANSIFLPDKVVLEQERKPEKPDVSRPIVNTEQVKRINSKAISSKATAFLLGSQCVLITIIVLAGISLYKKDSETKLLSKKQSELTAQVALYESMHNGLLKKVNNSAMDGKSQLDTKFHELLAHQEDSAAYLGQLSALKSLYHGIGAFKEARLLAGRVEQATDSVYGVDSEESIRAKLSTLDSLIALKNREEAYNTGTHILKVLEQSSAYSDLLVADAHIQVSRTRLICVEPYCHRERALARGQKMAQLAKNIYIRQLGSDSVSVADSNVLLNWYEFDGDVKRQLMEDAIRIYKTKLSRFDLKAIEAQEELSRIVAFFDYDWAEAELLLISAIEARQQILPHTHQSVARQKRYLGELYFMSGQYQKALTALSEAKELTRANIGAENNVYLEQIMLKSRTHLYSGEIELSQHELEQARVIIDESNLTPATIIKRALEVTQLRIDSVRPAKSIPFRQLRLLIDEQKDTFKSPKSVYVHEYLTTMLAHYPSETDENYISTLRELSNHLSIENRYFYPADLNFIIARARKLCSLHSEQLCDQVESVITKTSEKSVNLAKTIPD